jgi:hypothetical protein
MIHIAAHIRWPFKKWRSTQEYLYKTWNVSKNKTIELQIDRCGNDIIGFSFSFTIKEDHAGLMIDLSLLRYSINFQFVDNRHWNPEENRWVNYDNKEEVEKYW